MRFAIHHVYFNGDQTFEHDILFIYESIYKGLQLKGSSVLKNKFTQTNMSWKMFKKGTKFVNIIFSSNHGLISIYMFLINDIDKITTNLI